MADREQNQAPDPDELGSDWKAAWDTEDNYWEENFSSRPYALGPDYYDRFRPGYPDLLLDELRSRVAGRGCELARRPA